MHRMTWKDWKRRYAKALRRITGCSMATGLKAASGAEELWRDEIETPEECAQTEAEYWGENE